MVEPVIPTTRDVHGDPVQIEWGGVFFRRVEDREDALRARRQDVVRATIQSRAGADVLKLADELVMLAWLTANDEHDELLRTIGWMLVTNGRQDLWRLAYLAWMDGNSYVVNDEVRFLMQQPPAKPAPLQDNEAD